MVQRVKLDHANQSNLTLVSPKQTLRSQTEREQIKSVRLKLMQYGEDKAGSLVWKPQWTPLLSCTKGPEHNKLMGPTDQCVSVN